LSLYKVEVLDAFVDDDDDDDDDDDIVVVGSCGDGELVDGIN
jgi:hypothetical protein